MAPGVGDPDDLRWRRQELVQFPRHPVVVALRHDQHQARAGPAVGETGVGGVQVCANNGGPPVCTTTAADGSYFFTGLSAATWTVTETIATFPPGTIATTATSRAVGVAALQQVTGIDFGLRPWQDFATPGTIGDQLWVDANADGVLDPSEMLLSGVAVRLWIE